MSSYVPFLANVLSFPQLFHFCYVFELWSIWVQSMEIGENPECRLSYTDDMEITRDSISCVWHSRRAKSLKLMTSVHYYFQGVPPAHRRSRLSLASSSHPGNSNEHTVTLILWKLGTQVLTLFQGHSTILIYNNSQKQGDASPTSALKCRLASFQFKDSGSVSDGGYAPWTWRGGSSRAWGSKRTSVTDNGYVDAFFAIFEFYWTCETVRSVGGTPCQFIVDPFPVSSSICSYLNSNITWDEWIIPYSPTLFFHVNRNISAWNLRTHPM